MGNEKIYMKADGVKLPTRAHATDAGIDLYSPEDVVIKAHSGVGIASKVKVVLPKGTMGMIFPKSGLCMSHDLVAFGIIDEQYRGEIKVKIFNLGDEDYHLREGDKMTQMIVVPVLYPDIEEVDEVSNDTERGMGGFGSTGR